MTQNNLFLNRLIIVTNENKCAYDETFHRGVNIIRGQNSSGKSTILRFIFFVLGGTYQDFVPEALRCSHVVAEIEANGKVLTLKRYLEKTDDGSRCKRDIPMYIYFGSIDQYMADDRRFIDKWQCYPYKTTSETHSFSQVLFRYIGLPDFKADSNITMHQILRLIYLDQESPLSSLFFFDQWDRELTRETVARLLMGLYNSKLGDAKREKDMMEKDIEELERKKRVAAELLEDPQTMSTDFLKQMIENVTEEVQQITDRVIALRNHPLNLATLNLKLEYQRLKETMAAQRRDCGQLESRLMQLKAEIDDSVFFISALRRKRDALNHSNDTRDFFDNLKLDLCPVCLSELQSVEPGHCPVCNAPVDGEKGKTQAARIMLEYDFQIQESEALLKLNQEEYDELKEKHRTLRRQVTAAQKQYDNAVLNVRSSREEEIDGLLQEKGFKEASASRYRDLLEYAERYERISLQLSEKKLQLERLTNYIAATEANIEKAQEDIDAVISQNGLFLLRNDEDRQTEFMQASDFKVNYKQNVTYISNQRIKLSASSAFYLKMAARFALFFASLQEDSMLYPRFMFSDNMEDKGMEEERAKNFQRMIVKRLQEIEAQKNGTLNIEPSYQLIFATSNIADELNVPKYTIGDYYSQDHKSLRNV